MKSKHLICTLVILTIVVLFLIHLSSMKGDKSCGCGVSEGFKSPALNAMLKKSKEGLYKPKEGLNYLNHVKQGFVPPPSKQAQMKAVPVSKSMARSPFIG